MKRLIDRLDHIALDIMGPVFWLCESVLQAIAAVLRYPGEHLSILLLLFLCCVAFLVYIWTGNMGVQP